MQPRSRSPIDAAALLLRSAAVSAALAAPALAHSNDAVVLKNGNRLDGEIKKLDRSVLSFDTDSAGVIEIEWDDVLRLTGPGQFRVEVSDGTLHFGSLVPAPSEGVLVVDTGAGPVQLGMTNVVAIGGVDTAFWDKVDGRVQLGFSFTKASDVSQLSFSGGLSYSERLWSVELELSSISTKQSNAEDTSRTELYAEYERTLGGRRFAVGGLIGQQNSSLGLDLRVSAYGGGGRRFVQTNSNLLSGWAGIAASHDEPSGVGASSDDATGVLSLSYEIFVADTPKTSLHTTLNALPYVTDWGRVRFDWDLSLRKEIIKDFFLDLSFYADYDNEPPSLDASTSDFGIVTSFGYSF